MIGIGEVASGVSLAKEGYSFIKYFSKKGLAFFSKESLPLDWFSKQEITIISSSLFAPKHNQSYYSLVKPGYSDGNAVPVGSGFYVTGIYDTLALAKLSISLIQKQAVLSIGIDTIKEDVKNENLCLLGGTSSNLIGKEIYDNYLPSKHRFYSSNGGLNIHGTIHSDGECGHILFMNNPWNKNKKILWLAGLGPFGTGAAVDFLINSFGVKAPKELTKDNSWVLFIKGVPNKDGDIIEINPIGYMTF